MSLLARVRPSRAQPAAPEPVAAVPALAIVGPELADDELEQVVGGLERVFVPGLAPAR